jgi:hypothetical protein
MELYKEKLNLKPAGGGGGFMPHIGCFTAALLLLYCCFTAALLLLYCFTAADTPSLRAFTQGKSWAAHTFVTAMVAIDCMTEANGCLKVARPPQVAGLCYFFSECLKAAYCRMLVCLGCLRAALVLLLLYCCFTSALLLLYCCFTAVYRALVRLSAALAGANAILLLMRIVWLTYADAC